MKMSCSSTPLINSKHNTCIFFEIAMCVFVGICENFLEHRNKHAFLSNAIFMSLFFWKTKGHARKSTHEDQTEVFGLYLF